MMGAIGLNQRQENYWNHSLEPGHPIISIITLKLYNITVCPLLDTIQGFIQTPWIWGKIASIGGARDGGLAAVTPAGSRGRAPGQGVGVKPPEAGSFSLHK